MIYENPDDLGYFEPTESFLICESILPAREASEIENAGFLAHMGYWREAEMARSAAGYDRMEFRSDNDTVRR